MTNSLRIGFLLFPKLLSLDLTGPFGVLAAGPCTQVDLIWKDTAPVLSSDGLILTPTLAIADCPQLDVLCVPGGGGVLPLMEDMEILDFLRIQAKGLRYLCSVCTGSLVLGAAGLLLGRSATTHWQSFDMLAEFGAVAVRDRVVSDRRLFTSAGVSAGIDMALLLAGHLWGDDVAQEIQLNMEYRPEPPFGSGSPLTAPPAIVEGVRQRSTERQALRLQAVRRAAARLEQGL